MMKYFQAAAILSFGLVVEAQQTAWGQCGGINWVGATTCVSGFVCTYYNDYFSQCVPGTAPTTLATSTSRTSSSSSSIKTSISSSASSIRTSSSSSSTKASSSSSSRISTSSSSSASASATGKTRFAGVNMAGYDFGVDTTGTQDMSQLQTPDNAQFDHFVTTDKMNIFRLPAGWQFLVGNVLGGTLNDVNFARYDVLVQGCLKTGAYCILDIHNYARWNGAIVGQGGPTDGQLANVWSQLATKYKDYPTIIFGIMNEPHDVPNITTWATTVQASVTAIRQAGATSQMILLPGNGWTGAATFVSSGSMAALATVTNLDGRTTNLIYDVHIYLDSDSSGTHAECVTNNIDNAFAPLALALRSAGRQAILSETGGGNTASCVLYVCQQLAFLNANSDVYLGYVGWSAGGFLLSWNYVLSLVPSLSNGVWTDTLLMTSCFKRS